MTERSRARLSTEVRDPELAVTEPGSLPCRRRPRSAAVPRLYALAWLVAALSWSCHPSPVTESSSTRTHPSDNGQGLRPSPLIPVAPTPKPAGGGPLSEPVILTDEAKPPRDLPPHLSVGRVVELPVPGDRSLRVAHAARDLSHALVYLHGMCGNPRGADGWLDLATQRGTFIVVRANEKCPERPGYKWPKDVEPIHARIQDALAVVRAERNGLLDDSAVTLIGYSQGAHRAERLAESYPNFYPRVVLGGPPTSPEPVRLARALRVAVLGGELEENAHMLAGAQALQDAGIPARFFLLQGAHHGGYGPKGHAVMKEVLDWMY